MDIVALVSSWPGCRDRIEDGVRYVHIGLRRGGRVCNLVSYFVALPVAVWRRSREFDPDLLVEDFAAPIGSAFVPLFTRRPVLAVVQWLDAVTKSKRYHLPLQALETAGVRFHHTFIAMSPDLACELQSRHPAADVRVIPNGVEPAALSVRAERGKDIVFLGRLDIQQKGLDLLLEAVRGVRGQLPGRVVLAGDGPDEGRLRATIEAAGLSDVVVLAGRSSGAAKLRLLASAAVVAMPSRYETFGLVALEAMACGSPVVGFAIPSLTDLVTDVVGAVVPAFDVAAFGTALAALANDPARAEVCGQAGRERARAYDWDVLAANQAAVYREVVDRTDRTPPEVCRSAGERSVARSVRRRQGLEGSSDVSRG